MARHDFNAGTSTVQGITFPYLLSDNESYIFENRIRGIQLLKFRLKLGLGFLAASVKLRRTLSKRRCYYGPFKGEFGHFLAHNLPFLMYLHKKGVKITYCGMELHKPFMVDEAGNSIIHDFRPLRDFFSEVAPNTNSTVPPPDVQKDISAFEKEANQSGVPFWNIGDDYYYWFIHRHWLGRGHTH